MIDRGELCINPTTYRKVYLPTLAKAVQREMARRYTQALKHGVAEPDRDYEQLTLDYDLMMEVSK
jgi:predicted SprT family Zn-dependent metalloprotease